ncbi:uncharacterized protein [Nicotiana sylvestris]|uniref:uncharacterized protein n=1 Tax=Nicotiana sylvestris TaxID=4096 RepID=UPI00388C74AC
MVLKTDSNGTSDEDSDMAYLTRRFQKIVRRNRGIPKRGSSNKPKNYDICYKCAKRNPVPNKCFNRKNLVDNILKQALAAWGDSSSESKEENDHGDSSMMSNDDEDNDDDKTRDDLVVVVVDLKETIENLKKDKDALDEEITNIEQKRDDLMVVVVDLKETVENVSREKDVLIERVASIEHERYDLLVVVMDLKEIIRELKMESRHENSQKGKEVAGESHIKLRSELNLVKSSMCAKLEKNKQLQEELVRVKSDLEKSLRWTWFSDAITSMYTNNGVTGRGLGFKGKRFPIILIASTLLYLTIGFALTAVTMGTLKKTGIVKGSSLQWYMDSGCSKHMTGSTNYFLSLKALQGGSVSFGNGKKGYILGVGRIGKSLSHSIENVYYVNGLKYSLLSVSQICDKGNKVEFVSKICTITNLVTAKVVLVAKTYKNIYVANFESLKNGYLSCLSVVDDDVELWHRRLGHASFTLLNKLVRKDLVRGLPKSSFKDHKVCDAC